MVKHGGAPKAVTAASGAIIAPVETSSTASIYAKPPRPYRRIIVEAAGPNGPFAVIGQVAKPGSVPWTEGMRLVDALGQSGWFTNIADSNHVVLTRRNGASSVTAQISSTHGR